MSDFATVIGGAIKLASGYSMPMIGLGTSGIREAKPMEEAVESALASGYRLFDTAHGYRNEALLGAALQTGLGKHGIARADVFVTTKVPMKNDEMATVTREMLDQSLRDLQLEYIDLVLIHYPRHLIGGGSDDDPINSEKRRLVYGILEEYVAAGKIRSIGVSNYEIYHLLELPQYAKVPCSVNQCEYHPHHTQSQLRAYCKQQGIFFQAYASLCSGDDAILNEAVVCELAAKHGVDKQNILLSFALHTGVGVLPKSTNAQRVANNFRNTVAVKLADDELTSLLKLDKRQTYVGLCTPWRTL